MKLTKVISAGIFFLCIHHLAFSQCPTTNFNAVAPVCVDQNIVLSNQSSPGTYYWDFCTGDFNSTPIAQPFFSLAAANGRPVIELVKDADTWYGFVTGTFSNVLYRLEFGNGLSNQPTFIENLGDLSGKLNSPGPIRLVYDNGQWHGLIYNTGTGELLELNFGNKLSNSITTSLLYTNSGYVNTGLALGKDPVEGWICVLTTGTNQSNILRLGNLFSAPGPTDILTSASVPNPNNIGDVDLVNVCGNWIGFIDNIGNGNIYRLNFGVNLFSVPVITQVTSIVAGNPGRIKILKDGEDYFLLIIALDGTLTKLSFGADLNSSPTISNEGDIGGVLKPNTYGIASVRDNSVWITLAISQSNGDVYHIKYQNICSATPQISTLVNPQIKFSAPGSYSISLEVTSGLTSTLTRTVVVSFLTSPDINFDTQNTCANSAINFTSQNTSGNITNYAWDFGDTNTSAQPNPSHIYTTAGTYPIELQVTASNGCTNFSQSDLTIYNQPISDFSLPSTPPPICSNQTYSYTNTSTFDPASNPTWEWRLNGSIVSTATNLTQAFSSTTNHDIKLKTSIPGCSDEKTQNITGILAGPLVDFSASTGCQGSPLQFTNNTSGSGLIYEWDFGDGNTSTFDNPSNTYLTFGNFIATLHADNGVCNNSATKPITIYSKPQPNFSLDLPPFSCQGTPSQFNDLTPNPTDSNLSSWSWNFGDAANGTSGQRNPLYTYSAAGPYDVSLDVTTNFGCSASVQKTVTITTAPLVNFSNTPACVNQPTQFTDASAAGVKSWLWKIDNNTYMTSNPVHTFTTSGSHNVELTITGANDCIAQMIKTVTVPVALTPNFSVEDACSGKPSTFLDITAGAADPVVTRNWDFAGLGSATGASTQYTFATEGIYSIKLNTTHQSGCIYLGTKTTTIGTSPKSLFTSSAEGGPPPLTIKFSNSSTGASSYLWKFNDKANTTSLQVEPSFTFNELGEYQVELTSFGQQGCTDTFSKPIYIVEPKTDLSLTSLELLSDPNSGSLRPLVTIKNTGNIAVADVSILVDLSGGGSIKEKMQINLQPNQSFTQALVSELLPKGLNYVCAQVILEKDENLFDNKRCSSLEDDVILFAPYPNPNQGQLYLDWIATSGDVANVVIFNSTGANAYEKKITATQPGLSQIILDISTLGPGIYFVVFSYGSFTKTHRFMVN